MFDLTKRYVHMEDNDDGTMVITFNLGEEMADGHLNNTVVIIPGSIEEIMLSVRGIMDVDQGAKDLENRGAMIIPDSLT